MPYIFILFFFSKSSNLFSSGPHHNPTSAFFFEQQDFMNQFISEIEPRHTPLSILSSTCWQFLSDAAGHKLFKFTSYNDDNVIFPLLHKTLATLTVKIKGANAW